MAGMGTRLVRLPRLFAALRLQANPTSTNVPLPGASPVVASRALWQTPALRSRDGLDHERALLSVREGATAADIQSAYMAAVARVKQSTLTGALMPIKIAELSQAMQALMTTVNVARQPDRVPDREGSFVSSDPAPGKTPSPAQVRAMAMMEKAREYKEKKIRKEDAVEEPVPRWVELKREIDGTYSTALARLTDGAVDSLSIEHSVRRFQLEIKGLNATIDDYNLMVPMQRMQVGRIPESMVTKAVDKVKATVGET